MCAAIKRKVTIRQHIVAIGDFSRFQLRTVKPDRSCASARHQADSCTVAGAVCWKRETHAHAFPFALAALRQTIHRNLIAVAVFVGNAQLRHGIRKRLKECRKRICLSLRQRHILAGRHPACLIRLDHFQRLRAHVVRIRRIAVCASPIEALIRPDACRLHVVTIQEVHHAALHLGNRFWMVNRIAVRVFRKAGISQLVIHRDAVSVIIEMIEQLLAAQVVRDYRQAVLIRIPCAVRLHVLIIQRFVVQRRGVVVGDGLAVPVPQHFFQVDGGLRCRCRFRFDIENRFRDVIRRINFRQSRRKELILFPNENAPRCAANFSRCLTRMERSVAALR